MIRTALVFALFAASFATTLAGELVWANGEADYRFDIGPVPYDAFLLLRDAFHVPFRAFNGRELSLVPFFEMSEPEFQGVRAPERWTNFTVLKGSVLQTAANGGSLVRLTKGGSVVFVRNLPRSVDGSPLTVLAVQDGLHEYTSVSGAVSTVDAFDFGTRLPPARERELFEIEAARMKSERGKREAEAKQKAASVVAEREKAKRERQRRIDEAVAKFRAEQAAKGNTSP